MALRVVSQRAARNAAHHAVVDRGPVVHGGRIAEVEEQQRIVGLDHLVIVGPWQAAALAGTGKIGGIKNQGDAGMNLSELQADLRHFAAEHDWPQFHTPKNLSTALMVEAAELAEIFQCMTPEESQSAHQDPASKQRIGEEVADVLLYLLQLADHSEIDIAQAVKDKLVRNALKYPPKHTIPRVSPVRAAEPGTHVLLDFENVQPTEDELRALVPDASQMWVFHGPHQRQVEQRFASFGSNATAVPISKTGKNALDFHLSFYMGYLASRNHPSSSAPIRAELVMASVKGTVGDGEYASSTLLTAVECSPVVDMDSASPRN